MAEKYKVLVTDDNPDDLELFSKILSDDYEVVEANSGKACLELIKKHMPDVILLDVMMPEMDGYEVLRLHMKNKKVCHIPIIFITAKYSDPDHVAKVLNLGAFDYITKPYNVDILLARVKKALRYKKTYDEKCEKNLELEKRLKELKAETNNLQNCANSVTQVTNFIEQCGETDAFKEGDIKGLDANATMLFNAFKSIMNERSNAEEKLLRIDKHIKLHRQQTFIGVIEWDTNFRPISWNKAAERIFGFKEKDVVGKNINDLIFNTAEQKTIKTIQKELINKQKFIQHLSNNVSKDGEDLICEWSSTPIVQDNNQITGIVSLVNDITERQKANNILAKQREELELILNNMVEPVISIDEFGKILSFNKAAEDKFQYSSKDILGKNVSILMPDPYSSNHDNYIQNYVKTDEAKAIGTDREVNGLKANGEEFPIRLKVSTLPNTSSGTRRFMASCHDITIEKRQELELRRNQTVDALGRLTSGIAHDYNNLLGIVLGYANVINDTNPNADKTSEYIQEIIQAGERGRSLTNKFLSFTRKEQIKPEPVNINEILMETKPMLEATLTARINLNMELTKESSCVYTDRSEVSDILLNMSINAMHAIDGHGSLSFKTENVTISKNEAIALNLKAGTYLKLAIVDTGTGMDATTLSHIFDPFYTTKGESGTGLGLSQVYGVMQRSNGDVKVYSEIGEGTEFHLYFPIYDKYKAIKLETKTIKSTLETNNGPSKGTILIVDDNESILKMNKDILKMQGYEIFTALRVDDALKTLKTTSIDLVLSDVTMPYVNGFELSKIIRSEYPEIKIQLVSGYADNGLNVDGVEDLYNNILPKPFDISMLVEKVSYLINN